MDFHYIHNDENIDSNRHYHQKEIDIDYKILENTYNNPYQFQKNILENYNCHYD